MASARPERRHETEKGFLGLRAVLKDAHAEDLVEKLFAKREAIDTGLKNVKARCVPVICKGSLDGAAQIEGKNLRATFERELRKPSSATSRLQDALPSEVLRPTRAVVEALAAQIIPHDGIQL